MINAPQQPNFNVPQAQYQQRPTMAPSYNAVQINLDTPTLNAPAAMPYYPPVNMPANYQPIPQYPASPMPVQQAPAQEVPPPVVAPTQQPTVEVKAPEESAPETLADKAFKGLSSDNYDTQATVMEEIAKKGLNNSADAAPYLQENIMDKLVDIIEADNSNLAGPTDKQIELRNKIMENENAIAEAEQSGKDPKSVKLPHEVSAEETEEANKLSPFEQAERNKEWAMFTTAILQKTYADEIQKQTGSVPALSELPGSRAIISTLKNSDNPDMAVSAIDALVHVQRPEYKEDLKTLYTIAQSDSRQQVAEAATQALSGLEQK